MVLLVCKNVRFVFFSLGSWYLLFMFVVGRHIIAKEGENEALV